MKNLLYIIFVRDKPNTSKYIYVIDIASGSYYDTRQDSLLPHHMEVRRSKDSFVWWNWNKS